MKLHSLFGLIISFNALSFSVPVFAQNNSQNNESIDNLQCNAIYNVLIPDNNYEYKLADRKQEEWWKKEFNQIDTTTKPNLVSIGKNPNTSVESTTISKPTQRILVTMVMTVTEGKDKKTYLSWIRCPNSLMELNID